jgi:hypothetical protein
MFCTMRRKLSSGALARDKKWIIPERSHEANALDPTRAARARVPDIFPSQLLHLHLSSAGTTERTNAILGAAHDRAVGNE